MFATQFSHRIDWPAMKITAFLPLLALAFAASAVAQPPAQTPDQPAAGQAPGQPPRARRPPPPPPPPPAPVIPPPPPPAVGTKFALPASQRTKYDFNANWKFTKGDFEGAQAVGFDDSKWERVSTPHTMNEDDSFRVIIDHRRTRRGRRCLLSLKGCARRARFI
jgi:hypothetical protein